MAYPRVSIRFALMISAVLVVGLLVSLFAGSWVNNESRLVRHIATPIVELAQENTRARIAEHVEPIRARLSEAIRLVRTGRLKRDDPIATKELLLPGMYELKGVSSMMVGDEFGYQLLIMRYDERVTQSPLLKGIELPEPVDGLTQYCTREFSRAEWGQRSQWTLWSENGSEAQAKWSVELPDYDPRARPWLSQAIARLRAVEAAGSASDIDDLLIWTEVYTLFTSKTPGMSAAIATRDPSGNTLVVAIDLLLEDVDEFTRSFHPTPQGKAFVLTEDGRIVAMPCELNSTSAHDGVDMLLRSLAELEQAGIAGLSPILMEQYEAKQPISRYESDGGGWYASLRPFDLGGGRSLLIGVALPSDEISAMSGFDPRRIAVVATLGLILALLLAFFIAGRIVAPLQVLVGDSERIGHLDLTPRPPRMWPFSELQRLGDSLTSTRTALSRYVSARDTAKAELAASEARFRGTFEQAAVGLLHVSTEGRVLLANQKLCDMLGYSAAELHGMSVMEFTHPDHRAADLNRLQGLLLGEAASISWEKGLLVRDGSVRWAQVSTRLLRDPNGEPLYFVSAVLDIHERVQLEAKLRQSQKLEAVGRLAGGVAHDFNNLLTVISGYLQTAANQIPDEHPAREDLNEVDKAAVAAASLVQQLLLFARRDTAESVVIDALATVRECERMLRRVLGERIQLSVRSSGGPHNVLMNAEQFQQVLINLSINARDAMVEGGELSIVVSCHLSADDSRWIEVRVADNGHGMSEEVRMRAFEPFYTTKEVGRGTGLGLATCYGIIQMAGGDIQLHSTVDVGTTVVIRLPQSAGSPIPAQPQAPMPPAQAHHTLLLVEDEERIRSLMERELRRHGYRVLVASDGADALALAQTERSIDLLVSDVIMPVMHGGELATRLRELIPGLRVLLVSGYAPTELSDKLPADSSFLAKPYAPDQLVRRIRTLLDPAGPTA